ncbi:hypothetical protein [Shinella sp.]|uniref:hypothetical protein n=1 Tax=Shinella sp. TaxID=1870904 RepID=UPI003F713915
MVRFKNILGFILLLISAAAGSIAMAQGAGERFAGEASLGSQPAIPIHIELHRSGEAVTGTVSIPGATFELVDAAGANAIAGRFQGQGGSGALTLNIAGDDLAGAFELAGQPGIITAHRTAADAESFFRPPEQRLDLTTAQWTEDLDRLVTILTSEHASPFHRVSRAQFEQQASELRTAIPKLDGPAVAVEFRRLAALIGDGHTSVALSNGRPRLPIEFYWFEDGLRVTGVSASQSSALGAKLIAVNNVAVSDVTERLRAHIPQAETQWHFRAGVPALLANPDVLRAIGLRAGPAYTFNLETEDGAQKSVDMTAATDTGADATLSGDAPLWQRNMEQAFWSERLADGSVYVNWRSYDGLADNMAALLQSLDAEHPRRLIIDLRDNDGGDFNIGRAFVEEIKRRSWLNRRDVLYVMIGRKTFSAAMTNAVDFQHSTEAVLVGEPAGAAPNNWQEVRRFTLPNSGLSVGVSTRYYEFLPGKADLVPDLSIPPEPSDWGSPEDAGLRLVLAQPVP